MSWRSEGIPGWVWPALTSIIVAAIWLTGAFIPGRVGLQAAKFWNDNSGSMIGWMGITMGPWLAYRGTKAVTAMMQAGKVAAPPGPSTVVSAPGGQVDVAAASPSPVAPPLVAQSADAILAEGDIAARKDY